MRASSFITLLAWLNASQASRRSGRDFGISRPRLDGFFASKKEPFSRYLLMLALIAAHTRESCLATTSSRTTHHTDQMHKRGFLQIRTTGARRLDRASS